MNSAITGPTAKERGHALFYALIVTPFVFGIGTILIDLSRFRTAQEHLLEEAEQIAQHAASALPDRVRAENLARAEWSTLENVSGSISFPGEGTHTAMVTLSREFSFAFDFLFRAFGQERLELMAEVSSAVAIAPTDTVLVLPDGDTLRPRYTLSASGQPLLEAPWGNNEDFPASRYLTNCVFGSRYTPTNQAAEWIRNWRNNEALRWATQACYNPVLSPLKRAAILIAQELGASGLNQLSVIFTPGVTGADLVRPLRSESGVNPVGGLFELGRTRVGGWWSDDIDPDSLLGNTSCALFAFNELAQSETSLTVTTKNSGAGNCRAPFQAERCGRPYDPFDHSELNSCFFSSEISIEEIILWRAAQLGSPSRTKRPNIIQALSRAYSELLAPPTSEETTTRLGLSNASTKRVILITDTLPSKISPTLSDLLNQYAQAGVSIYIGSFIHEGLSSGEISNLRDSEKLLRSAGYSNVKLLSLNNPDELGQLFYTAITLDSRRPVVRYARTL